MRIRRISSPGLTAPVEPPVGSSPAHEGDVSHPHDSAAISRMARRAAASRVYVEDAPDVRELRVRALKKAVQNGHYEADAEEIARKILGHGLGNP